MYMIQGKYSEALQILNGNPQLNTKAFIASSINKIITGVTYVQSLFNQDVTIFLSDLATKYFSLVDNFRNRLKWLNNVQYVPYNFVVFLDKIYMCLRTPEIGVSPNNTDYWLELGLKGKEGSAGLNLNMKYNWDSVTEYSLNDLVVYKRNIYVALTSNIGKEPDINMEDWLLFLVIGESEIYVNNSPPINYTENTVWFKTKNDIKTQQDLTPVSGTFKRYNDELEDWEVMNPNTVHTQIINYENLMSSVETIVLTIPSGQWHNNTWNYQSDKIKNNSVINIKPSENYNEQQIILINSLTLNIVGNTLTLSKNISSPAVDLPIIIRIW